MTDGYTGAGVWIGFTMMCIGMFMAVLDVQVVATSLTAIQDGLDVPLDRISWIQTAYLTAEVIAIPLSGLLTRVLGMRWLFVSAVTCFTLASIGCAASSTIAELIGWRVIQGFSGGMLIPAVFSAVFVLFPPRLEAFATMLAGALAVLAPTVGPVVGGWVTFRFSWHWLFLINVLPGVFTAALAALTLPRSRVELAGLRRLDVIALASLALSLAALQIALKRAPEHGWSSPGVLMLVVTMTVAAALFAARSLTRAQPIVQLATLRDSRFAIACGLSFVLGIGLFGSVYAMPVFLAVVRGHDSLEIGKVMLVTGVAQLLTAPAAVLLERRVDPRLLATFGFALFALGLMMSTGESVRSDFDEMFWPQMVRGVAIMFCLLPPTRLALGHLAPERVPDASGLFNLMRNLGGAIGIALIDTLLIARTPIHAAALTEQLQRGDVATARWIGIPVNRLGADPASLDPPMRHLLARLLERASMTQSLDEAWWMMAAITALAVALMGLAFARSVRRRVPARTSTSR